MMDTLRGPSSMGLSHMAVQAKEARHSSASAKATTPPLPGNEKSETGNSLPPTEGSTAHSHDVGLQRAIERLQLNVEKNPEAQGLQQALQKLQAKVPSTLETSA